MADLNGSPAKELMKNDSDGQLGDGELNRGVAAGTRRRQGSRVESSEGSTSRGVEDRGGRAVASLPA